MGTVASGHLFHSKCLVRWIYDMRDASIDMVKVFLLCCGPFFRLRPFQFILVDHRVETAGIAQLSCSPPFPVGAHDFCEWTAGECVPVRE
jgi:hypothetical protein